MSLLWYLTFALSMVGLAWASRRWRHVRPYATALAGGIIVFLYILILRDQLG